MKQAPLKGDLIELLETDLKEINPNSDYEDETKMLSENQFKYLLNNKIKLVAFKQLQATKAYHKKMEHIKHTDLRNPQKYIQSIKFSNKMCSILFNFYYLIFVCFIDYDWTRYKIIHNGKYSQSYFYILSFSSLPPPLSPLSFRPLLLLFNLRC